MVLSLLHFFIVAPTLVFLGIFSTHENTIICSEDCAGRIVFYPGHGWSATLARLRC